MLLNNEPDHEEFIEMPRHHHVASITAHSKGRIQENVRKRRI